MSVVTSLEDSKQLPMRQAADLRAAQARIASLYQSETIDLTINHWRDALVEHFAHLEQGDAPVLNWSDPADCVRDASSHLDDGSWECDNPSIWLPEFSRLLETILARGQNLHHRRYIGHQVPASVPIAALFDAIGTSTNQVMAIYEMGPWATAVERSMIARLGAEIGYAPESFGGIMTNGGSIANLTALLTARNVAIDNAWQRGVHAATRAALVVQQDVHYCVVRAAGILGIGTDNVIRIPVDERRKMRVDVLDETLSQLKIDGRGVIAVVAGACATPIGAFDPLDRIADVCERHKVWFHVDAAHGGAALMSESHRHLMYGISRADSVVWDAHKMLFMPALSAFVFYKHKPHRFAAFEQDAPYLFDPSNPGIAEYDSGTQTIECTKRALGFAVWGTWSLFGRAFFRDLVDVTFHITQQLHTMLDDADDFEPLHQPECNIQVFRYAPESIRHWDHSKFGDFQLELRRRVITSGEAYIVPIKIDGVGALRATVINPCTTRSDVEQVLNEIRRCGDEILRKQ